MARRYYSSTAVVTSLTGGINNSDTSIVVGSTSGFPGSTPFTLILDRGTASEEIVTVTAVAGTTLTVTRGVDGSSAKTHSAAAAVEHGVSAREFDEANEHVNATTSSDDPHPQYTPARIFIPATQAYAVQGSPSLTTNTAGDYPVWRLDASTDEAIAVMVGGKPATWGSVDVTLVWGAASNAAGDVTFLCQSGVLGVGGNPTTIGGGTTTTEAAGGSQVLHFTEVRSAAGWAASELLTIRIEREAAAITDTYGADVCIYGFLLTEA